MPSVSIPAAISAFLLPTIGETAAAIAGPAIFGAGVGALGSAVTGGKPLKGALIGGLTGGVLGGAGAAFPETMGSVNSFLANPFGAGAGGAGQYAALDEAGNYIPGAAGFAPSAGQFAQLGADGSYIPGAEGFAGPGGPNAGSSLGALGRMVGGGGGGGGNGRNASGGISPLALGIGALNAFGTGSRKPDYSTTPGPGSTAATQGPLFNATLPASSNYINRQASQNYQPAGGDWYKYGEFGGGQPQFFAGNQVTIPGMAHGGALTDYAGGGEGRGPVKGAGDGLSDSVPARLSEGEYVLTASDVSRIGQGSTEAGVKKLDQMRSQIARDAGATKYQKKVKHPAQYLNKKSTGRGR